MSENDKHMTATLLPEAKVAVYSKDSDTLKSAEETRQDWRFARVKIAAEDGDVETAIAFYEDQPSPDLIIIQTDEIDDALTDNLERLAAHCDEGTAAIVIGPDNDVYLYRKLIEMGVSDYLVKPVSVDIMTDVIAKTLVERLGVSDSTLIAFVGAKGGVGASSLAQAMTEGLADIWGQKTILIDGSGGWSKMNINFDFEPTATLSESAKMADKEDDDGLGRMIVRRGDTLRILGTGSDIMLEDPVDPFSMEHLLDRLLIKYPVMVADLSHCPPELSKTIISRANHIVLTSTPMLPSLRLARSLAQEIKEIRGGEEEGLDLVINMQGMDQANEVTDKDIEAATELKISAKVPYSPDVFVKPESEGKTILDGHKTGRALIEAELLPLVKQHFPSVKIDNTNEKKNTGLFGAVFEKLKSS